MKKIIALICLLALILCWMPTAAQALELETESSNAISGKSAVPAVKLRFASATLTLENDLTLTYYVRPAVMEHYSNVRVEFAMNGVTTVVDSPTTVNGSGQSGYAYEGVSPRMMKDDIAATIYGTYDGVEYSYTMHYNAAKYCYSMLSASNDPVFKTLLVDLLNFGTAHQIYVEYKTKDLINAELTDEQAALASSYEQSFTSVMRQTGTNDTASWSGITLALTNAIDVRTTLRCTDINGLSVCFTVDGKEFWVDSSEWKLVEGYSDKYYVYFEDLKARQLGSEIACTVYRGEYPTSKTLYYSVESYAAHTSSPYDLVELMSKMMYYGQSAYNFVNS